MKVLFIGGTGNISTAVSKLATSMKIDLFLLNRGTKNINIDGVKNIHGNIKKYSCLKKELKKHTWDVVVNWIAFKPADIKRDIKLFSGKTKQYIFISSASAYQKPMLHPVVDESTPLCNPYWQYSCDKIACEDLLVQEYRKKGFPTVIVRPSLTYDTVIPAAIGSWTDYTLIDRIKQGKQIIIHDDGNSKWTITHSQDFAKGFVGLLGNMQTIGHAFNITSDEVLTWNQIYQAMADAVNCKLNAVHIPTDFIVKTEPSLIGTLLGDKAVSIEFNNAKIKRFVPNFKASIPFAEGIKKTIQWFESNPNQIKIIEQNNIMIDRIIKAYNSR